MGIVLSDAMKIGPFERARLVGGHEGVSRTVHSANIQEVPGVDRWLKGGEILFTAGYAFQNAKNGCDMMEKLNQVGIAALAIKPGQYLKEIPSDMIELANQLKLPLFELPEDLPYMDCIISIFERITQEQLLVLKRAQKIHAMLTESILNKDGLAGICSVLNHATESPVFIISCMGSMLAYQDGMTEPESHQMNQTKNLYEDFFALNNFSSLRQNRCNCVTMQNGSRLVVVPIYVQDAHIAFLALDMQNKEPVEMDMIAFEQASSMVAVELLNEKAMWQQEQKVKEQLLEDLLMKRYSDESLVIRRGQHLGFDLEGRYCLFSIDADSFEDLLKNETMGLTEDKVQQIKNKVQQAIRGGMNSFRRPFLILDSSVGCVGMISVRKDTDVSDCAEAIDGILAEIGKLKTNLTFSAGIGRVKEGIQHVDLGRREAVLAMRAGRYLNRGSKANRTHCFEEMGCICFLSELSGSQAMRDFYNENMQKLIEYDKATNSELVKTLETHYLCKQNLRETAEQLFVHKNSVVYRLNKIESILGRPLGDHQTAFDLQLCFRIKNIL